MTIPELFEESVKKYPGNTFLQEKKNGRYISTTFKDTKDTVYLLAAGLLSLGIKKHDRAALLAEGRNEWVISELAILYTGAVNIPLSVKLNEPEEIKFRLAHSGSRFAFVSANQLKKIRPIADKLKDLEHIIVLDNINELQQKEILYKDIVDQGKKYLKNHQEIFIKKWQDIKQDDYANICYTSGTTADPKGIILTHRNYTANVEQAMSLIDVPQWFTTLLILPWDHSFAHTAGIYTLMKNGATMASVQSGKTPLETLKNIPENIKEIKPVFLLSVPALAKNFKKNIDNGIRSKGKIIKKLYYAGLKVAYLYNGNGWNKGKGWRTLLKPLYFLFDRIIFKKIRDNFGSKLQFFIGGGALLDIDLQKFFYAIRIPIYQGYGLTEAAPIISANSPKKHKMGTSGSIVNNLVLEIRDEDGNALSPGEKGEIVVKGENVMKGYWNNDSATRETIKNGWLHTGDLGYLDNDGFLYVLGRFKSLLIADDGEKFSPEGIEEALIYHCPFIDQCMLYNNQKSYTVALVVLNIEALKRHARTHHHLDTSSKEGREKLLKVLLQEINEYRTGGKYADMFPQRWLPVAVGILPESFSENNHMINSTMKMVRGKITEHYATLIDKLYLPKAKNICHEHNMQTINDLLK